VAATVVVINGNAISGLQVRLRLVNPLDYTRNLMPAYGGIISQIPREDASFRGADSGGLTANQDFIRIR
jgi:hypothetical protein